MTNGEFSDSHGSGKRPPSAEQRRSPRYPVFLDALIAGEGFESRACKIRDFCSNGIFVSFEGETGAGMVAQRPLVQGEPIGIHFTVTVGDRDSAHELKARVVRVLTSGVGAELIRPDPVAVAALTQAAQSRAPVGEAALPDLVRGQDKTKVERMAVLREIRRRLERGFNHWMDHYFSNVEAFLLNVSRDTTDATLQRAIWQFGQTLKQKRAAIAGELRNALLEQYDHACTRGVASASRPGESKPSALGDGLALVETDEFEQFLAVSEAVDRAETALGRALFELNQRLSFLYGTRIDKGNNPFGPAFLARQVGDYLRKSHPGAEVLRAALQAYQELAVPEIQRFYEDTNDYLAHSGVPLAGETARPRVISSAPRRRPESATQTMTGSTTATGGPFTSGAHVSPTVQNIASQIEQLAASLPAGTPLMVTPVNAFQAAHTLFGLGRDLQRGMPGRATVDGFGAATGGSIAHYTLGEIGSALRALEMTSGEPSGMVATITRSQLENALAAQSPAAPAAKGVRDADWDLLELVLELFNAIGKDPRVIPEVKPLLRKLRRPVNMVALSDKRFFEQTDHPARRVLNNLSRVRSAKKGDSNESILPELDFIVDKVVNEAAENPNVFSEAEERLDVLLAEQEREMQHNLTGLAQAAEAQAQFMKSRRKETTGGESRMQTSTLGEDWMAWINRVRRLKVGDEIMVGSGAQQRLLKLAWTDEDGGSYVFADPIGHKAGSFGMQELAMQLRRGTARLVEDVQLPTVERAMVKSLETLHGRLEQQVHSDVVTHLLNEKAFAEQVDQALALARQERESQVVAFVEVHEPAAVQQLPEAEREQRLRDRAARFRNDLPPEAQAARLGENRFGVLLRDYSQGRGFAAIEKVLNSLQVTDEDAVSAGGAKARAGLVPFSTEPVSADQVLKSAQAALALAQAPGSAPIRIVHVDEDGDTGVRVSSRLGEHLRLALDNDRLRLALQRIVPQAQGTSPSQLPTHVELVPSMQLPGGTRVSARALRAAAEQLQRTGDLDRWLVRAAMRWVVDNPERLPAGGMCIIVLTAESLRDPGTATFIGEEFINTAAPPGRFCFEVTEAPGAEASLEVSELVNALREYGCRFLYGDFGGEASSFTRVATLKVNLVRIGRMATRDIANDKGDAALVKSAVEMAHFFGMPAIADCIDSKAALAKTKDLGIEYAQGAAVSPVELAV